MKRWRTDSGQPDGHTLERFERYNIIHRHLSEAGYKIRRSGQTVTFEPQPIFQNESAFPNSMIDAGRR